MKRTLIISIIFTIIHFPFGCRDGCGTDLSTPMPGMKIKELSANVGSIHLSNRGNQFNQAKTYHYDSAAIQILITDTEEVVETTRVNKAFSFINSSYACEQVPAYLRDINSIIITSDSTIYSGGKEYKPGENLAELFKVSKENSTYFRSIDSFIEYRNRNFQGYIFREAHSSALFQLESIPDSAITQRFTFSFEFEDDEEIIVRTPVFEVDS